MTLPFKRAQFKHWFMRLCGASKGSVQEHVQMGKTTPANRCHITDT